MSLFIAKTSSLFYIYTIFLSQISLATINILIIFLQSETDALKPVFKRPCPTDDDEACPEGIDYESSDDGDSDYGDEDDPSPYSSTTPQLTQAKPVPTLKKPKPKSPLRHFLFLMSCCVASVLPSALMAMFSAADETEVDYASNSNYCCFAEPLTMT